MTTSQDTERGKECLRSVLRSTIYFFVIDPDSSSLLPTPHPIHFLIWSWEKIEHSKESFGEGNGTPLQYSCLENPMDGGAWRAAVHGVAEGRTLLSDFTFTFHFHALKKEMATHSSVLAWRIPGTGEPGGLPSMGSQRVGDDWSDFHSWKCREIANTEVIQW